MISTKDTRWKVASELSAEALLKELQKALGFWDDNYEDVSAEVTLVRSPHPTVKVDCEGRSHDVQSLCHTMAHEALVWCQRHSKGQLDASNVWRTETGQAVRTVFTPHGITITFEGG